MANQKINVKGKEYGVWYYHSSGRTFIEDCLHQAEECGQIDTHALDFDAPYVSHVTRCQLENPDRTIASVGFSFCSENDNFNKKTGRRIALARAINWIGRDVLRKIL